MAYLFLKLEGEPLIPAPLLRRNSLHFLCVLVKRAITEFNVECSVYWTILMTYLPNERLRRYSLLWFTHPAQSGDETHSFLNTALLPFYINYNSIYPFSHSRHKTLHEPWLKWLDPHLLAYARLTLQLLLYLLLSYVESIELLVTSAYLQQTLCFIFEHFLISQVALHLSFFFKCYNDGSSSLMAGLLVDLRNPLIRPQ